MKFINGSPSNRGPRNDRLSGEPLPDVSTRPLLANDDLTRHWHRDEIPYYGLDIETDTTINGLDPAHAAVVAVALTAPFGEEVLTGDERSILERLNQLLTQLPPGVIVTWNGSSFDLPFLAVRAQHHDIELSLRLTEDQSLGSRTSSIPGHPHPYRASWGPHRHLDGYRLYRADVGRGLGFSCGLKPMARLVGLEPVEVDREQIHLLTPQELHEYVASDARLACELVRRRLPAAATFADPFTP